MNAYEAIGDAVNDLINNAEDSLSTDEIAGSNSRNR